MVLIAKIKYYFILSENTTQRICRKLNILQGFKSQNSKYETAL